MNVPTAVCGYSWTGPSHVAIAAQGVKSQPHTCDLPPLHGGSHVCVPGPDQQTAP